MSPVWQHRYKDSAFEGNRLTVMVWGEVSPEPKGTARLGVDIMGDKSCAPSDQACSCSAPTPWCGLLILL